MPHGIGTGPDRGADPARHPPAVRSRGRHGMYSGEPVTQLEHALQTAIRPSAPAPTRRWSTAALLHDLGHLLNDHGETPTARGIDDVHQYAALPFLRAAVRRRRLEPIRLHVDAKRYLCATEPRLLRCAVGRFEAQPGAAGWSIRRIAAVAFAAQPGAARAIALRHWDDAAKDRRRGDAALRTFRSHHGVGRAPRLMQVLLNLSGRRRPARLGNQYRPRQHSAPLRRRSAARAAAERVEPFRRLCRRARRHCADPEQHRDRADNLEQEIG